MLVIVAVLGWTVSKPAGLLNMGAEALGVAYAKSGRPGDAEHIAAISPLLTTKVAIFAALGDKDRTLEIVNQMLPAGPTRIGRDILNNPDFAFLRDDPRLTNIRRQVGLPVSVPLSR